jgi:hypothetical protein
MFVLTLSVVAVVIMVGSGGGFLHGIVFFSFIFLLSCTARSIAHSLARCVVAALFLYFIDPLVQLATLN